MIPTEERVKNNAVPPWLTKSKGIPDRGKTPSIADILKNDCDNISITIPKVKSPPNKSGLLLAILNPWKVKKRKNKISKTLPTKPNSSAATAKMESPTGSGRKSNF